nr:hypothetical protein [uncultured Rhodopila sp.]
MNSNADLAALAAAGRTDVIPKHTLSPLRIRDFGELQRHFESTCLRVASNAGEGLSEDQAQRVLDRALVLVGIGFFRYGSDGFDGMILAIDQLPTLLWACLRAKHPRITPAAAELLITDENRTTVRSVCLELAGYGPRPKKKEQSDPPTGPESSPPSESEGSPSTTSST